MTAAELLTVGEVAERLRVCSKTVLAMLGDGRLQGVKVAGQWRIGADQVDVIAALAGAAPRDMAIADTMTADAGNGRRGSR